MDWCWSWGAVPDAVVSVGHALNYLADEDAIERSLVAMAEALCPGAGDCRTGAIVRPAGSDAIDAERVYAWIVARIGGRPDQQWQVARILGPATRCLALSDLLPFWVVSAAADHVVVAAEAVRFTAPVADMSGGDAHVRARVEHALRRLLVREGSLGPLAAGHALVNIEGLTSDDAAVVREHSSSQVRGVLDRHEG